MPFHEFIFFSLAAITCPDLEDPQYGTVETTDNRVGDVANYECNFGFRLVGSSQLTCLVSGEWSDEVPTCERKLTFMEAEPLIKYGINFCHSTCFGEAPRPIIVFILPFLYFIHFQQSPVLIWMILHMVQ